MSTAPTAVTHGQILTCPLRPTGNGVTCSKVLRVLSLEHLDQTKERSQTSQSHRMRVGRDPHDPMMKFCVHW